MKRRFKKLCAFALAAVMTVSLSFTAFPAGAVKTAEESKETRTEFTESASDAVKRNPGVTAGVTTDSSVKTVTYSETSSNAAAKTGSGYESFTYTKTYPLNDDMTSEERLNGLIERILYGEPEISLLTNSGRALLDGKYLEIYEEVIDLITKVAYGEETITYCEYDPEESGWYWEYSWDDLADMGLELEYQTFGKGEEELKDAYESELIDFLNNYTEEAEYTALIYMLMMVDYPYEVYWTNEPGFVFSAAYDENSVVHYFKAIAFTVASEYAPDGAEDGFEIDPSNIIRATTAAANAQEIADSVKGMSVEDQVYIFFETICDLVDYDRGAEEGDATSMDPWYVINVFDGDPDTNVVCMGYSMAFKYLCDLAGIDDCYIAMGYLMVDDESADEGHAWNVISIDGIVYMLDITNSDLGDDEIDPHDLLYLLCADDAVVCTPEMYTFEYLGHHFTYEYMDETLAMYPIEKIALTSKASTDTEGADEEEASEEEEGSSDSEEVIPSGSTSSGTTSSSHGSSGSSSSSSLSGRTLDARWEQDENGNWRYYIPARMFENEWGYIYNPYADPDNGQAAFDWFHFGEDGMMDTGWFTDKDGYIYYLSPEGDGTKGHMLTGWQWIKGSDGRTYCYYFNESKNENPGTSSSGTRPYGSLYISAVTPDGYTVDETGAYVENGVRVTK